MSTLPFSSSLQLLSESAKGTVDRLITSRQTGRVKYRGTYWSARLYQPEHQMVIDTGESVRIVAIQGITLLVVPEASP